MITKVGSSSKLTHCKHNVHPNLCISVKKKSSATKLKLNTLISKQDLNKRDLVTMDESPTLEEDVETPGPHPLHNKSGETNKTSDPDEDFSEDFEMVNMGDNYPEEDDIKDLETLLEELEQDYDSWVELRRKTVVNLREIADYIDSVSKKSGLAKVYLDLVHFKSVRIALHCAVWFRLINSALFTLGHW